MSILQKKITQLTSIHIVIALLVISLFQSSAVLAESSKKLADCESCHKTQAGEFQASVHYINRSGVQAGCNNCHAYFQHKNGDKTAKVVKGDRLEMAAHEWKRMQESDSKACKTCHSPLAMDLAKQEPRSVLRHEDSFDEGNTSCINCHKGISHYLPAGWKEKAKALNK